MGSKNPSRLLTRTTSQSESTRVPRDTYDTSRRTARSTGADSPVTAPSVTDAAPSITVPSAGMMSLASTNTRSPRRSVPASTRRYSLRLVPSSRFAYKLRPINRSVAARALPHSAATDSAKFASRTLNHSHAAMARTNVARRAPSGAPTAVANPKIVVKMLATYTPRVTGFRNCTRGTSFVNEFRMAADTIARLRRLVGGSPPGTVPFTICPLRSLAGA